MVARCGACLLVLVDKQAREALVRVSKKAVVDAVNAGQQESHTSKKVTAPGRSTHPRKQTECAWHFAVT